ncbi:MAG: hypothetical protein Unbinned3849contig1000_42 [Prokaryotic dsDNA virus sp.]|nr:MAG: hypothetical protein Unbinned3849contig1000_42 [Prokaryotic dsDNA virus sp.]|tara:strand:- start:11619 stop:13091 length:1473 start_codon:yes stop_codon:yes gene_type:complete
MADLFNLGNLGVTDSTTNDTWSAGSTYKTGDLRRKYNFGNRVSELSIAQDPFFRFVSKVGKKPTDDPTFKFTEKRGSWYKRYAYVVAHAATSAVGTTNGTITAPAVDTTWYLKMETDYMNDGNRGNVYGQASNKVGIGVDGTQPQFFLEDQIIKVNLSDGVPASGFADVTDYALFKVTSVDTTTDSNAAILGGKWVKASAKTALTVADALTEDDTHSYSQETLEKGRCYVVGSSHEEGSGYPETWKDQPYVTGYGQTQIWKTTMAMTNTARATVLKYEPNEWARVWKEKLVEHKWDIEQSLLFGTQQSTVGQTTQGAVDFIGSYGNVFALNTTTKTADDFLDDMSAFLDPRYNNANATVFFCDTATFNWLHKLGGFFSNNIEISANFRADLAITGRKKVLGLDTTTITTVYGDMQVVRNIHLDGSNIKMLAINMKNCKYRPLVGNGLNRDTSVYVGVQTLENSGVDRRVDQILTEAGMEWSMPESHAYWA